MDRLERFRTAQRSPHAGFDAALRELESGRKRGHWIWYILPQLSGLGMSATSQRFAIADEREAIAYLRDPELRGRLLAIARVVEAQLARGVPLRELMGSDVDAQKTVSSLTLFGEVASRMARPGDDDEIRQIAERAAGVLGVAETQGHPRCAHTLQRLRQPAGGPPAGET